MVMDCAAAAAATTCCAPAGNVAQWGQYTTGPYHNIHIEGGDHYFVSTHYQVHQQTGHCWRM